MGDEMSIEVSIPEDEEGFSGRECPECEGYFKIEFGTGLEDSTSAYCPYCGFNEEHDHFYTEDQIEYVQSVAMNAISEEINEIFEEIEYDGDYVSIEYEGATHPIHMYKEKKLETEVVCDNCSLRYEIYGAFSYCPDCGIHNSFQIFQSSLETTAKIFEMDIPQDDQVKRRLLGNALEDIVSSFDGFGRALCAEYSNKAGESKIAENMSFQNLDTARERIEELFDFDFCQKLSEEEWKFICKIFQKRHLISHNMGVIDEEYVERTNTPEEKIGNKIELEKQEIDEAIELIENIGKNLFKKMKAFDSK